MVRTRVGRRAPLPPQIVGLELPGAAHLTVGVFSFMVMSKRAWRRHRAIDEGRLDGTSRRIDILLVVADSADEAAKRELAARTWRGVQAYADAKTTVVEAILALDEAP
jgi:hypothetical protein